MTALAPGNGLFHGVEHMVTACRADGQAHDGHGGALIRAMEQVKSMDSVALVQVVPNF